MARITTALLLAISVICASASSAKAEHASFEGPGMRTCGQFAHEYAQSPDRVESYYFFWAEGFMSGMNVAMGATEHLYRDLNALSVNDQQAELRSYCNEHPLAHYIEAVQELYGSLPAVRDPK